MELVATIVLFAGVPLVAWLLACRDYWKARARAWQAYALRQEWEIAKAREAARVYGSVVAGICSCAEPKSEELK